MSIKTALFHALLIALTALVCVGVARALAFEPPNVPNWPGVSSSPFTQKVAGTGVMTYEAVDTYGWSGWRTVVGRALSTASDDQNSWGHRINAFLAAEGRGSVVVRERAAGETPDYRAWSVPTAALEQKCGTWATACVVLLNPLPVDAWHKSAQMILWSYTSQAAVIRHEFHHAAARACDQYEGGCPRVSDGRWASQVVCRGNPDTLMDCGGAAVTVMPFDYRTFVSAYPADAPFLRVAPPPPPPPPPCVPTLEAQCWVFIHGRWAWLWPNGWSIDFEGSPCGNWYDNNGLFAFGYCDDSWNGRHVPILGPHVWLVRGTHFYIHGWGWYVVP